MKANSAVLEITNACNLRCRMCSIWKEKERHELSLADIKSVISQMAAPVSVSLTGGECFLHPTISSIYKYLSVLRLKKKLRGISITTHGCMTEKIMGFLRDNENRLSFLGMGVSIDGIGDTHDKQRGVSGAFRRTLKTLKCIRSEYPEIQVSVKFTTTPLNHRELYKVYALSKKLSCQFEPKLAEKLEGYYHRAGSNNSALDFSKTELEKTRELMNKALDDYRQSESKTDFTISAIENIIKFLESGSLDFVKKCLTPSRSIFVTSRGDVYPCIYYEPAGNIRNTSLSGMLSTKESKKIIDEGVSGSCPKCLSYHGFLRHFNFPCGPSKSS